MPRSVSPTGLSKAGIAVALAVVTALVLGALGVQWRVTLFWVVFLPCAWLLWCWRRTLMESPERLFLFLALPTGLLMCAFMPTIVSVSWDGYVHYKVANQIAQGETFVTTGADAINYDMDGIYAVGLVPWGTSDNDWDPNWAGILTEQGMEKASERFAELGDVTYKVSDGFFGWGVTTMGRIPNALGLWLGDLLGAPYLLRLFLGRLTNLLFWILLVWLAMTRLKSGKHIVCAIGLLPILFFEACNYSYDPWCVGFLLLGFASFVGELQRPEKPLTLGGALWILAPFTLGVLIKAAWIPGGLFLLFLPQKKFRTRGARVLWILACVVVALGVTWTFMGPFLSRGGSGYSDSRGEALTSATVNIDSAEQLAQMAENPLRFLWVLVVWFVGYLNPWPIFEQLFVNFCYLPRPVLWPLWTVGEIALLALATSCDRTQADDGWPSRALRIAAIVGIVLAYCLPAISLYLGYTNVGADYILGMQMRYMLLYLPLVLLLVLNLGTRSRAWVQRRVLGPVAERLPERWRPAAQNPADVFAALQSLLAWVMIALGFLVRF